MSTPYGNWDALNHGLPGTAQHSHGPDVERHLASVPEPPSAEPPGHEDTAVDWAVVRQLQKTVAEALSRDVAAAGRRGEPLDRDSQRELGRAMIVKTVTDFVDDQGRTGSDLLTTAQEQALVSALFNAQFGLGRLQPLMDMDGVENIEIIGTKPVRLEFSDGHYEWRPPIADTNEDLVAMVRSWAAYLGQTARDFSTAHPLLQLSLPDMTRLVATMDVSPIPNVTIRRHLLLDVGLPDLEAAGTVDHVMHAFCRAMVRSRKNVVVAGTFGVGKTTFLRALANEIHPDEKIVTIEQQFELGLHLFPERHHLVIPEEERKGNSEGGAGAVTLSALVEHAMVQNAGRIIVGEVKGAEFVPMITAMAAGDAGSMSTIHAMSAQRAFTRFESCGQRADPPMSQIAVNLAVGDAVHYIIHLRMGRNADGARVRFVSEVIEITGPGENDRPAYNHIFSPGPDGRAKPTGVMPAYLDDLVDVGFDASLLEAAVETGWGGLQ